MKRIKIKKTEEGYEVTVPEYHKNVIVIEDEETLKVLLMSLLWVS